MKKLLLTFICIFSIIKGNYLISNGEIALFYDRKNNIIKNIRGDIYQKDKIANIEILLVDENLKTYRLSDYYTEFQYVGGKNILRLNYKVNAKSIETYIVAPMYEKDRLYIYTRVNGVEKKYKIVYQITPIDLVDEVKREKVGIRYDGVFISDDVGTRSFLADSVGFSKFKIRDIDKNLKKDLEEKIFIWNEIDGEINEEFLIFDFSTERFEKKLDLKFFDILNQEIKFWKDLEEKYKNQQKETINILKDFYILKSQQKRADIILTKTNEEYLNELRMIYVEEILNKNSINTKFFSEILFEDRDVIKNIYYYYYFIKIALLKNLDINLKPIGTDIDEKFNKNFYQGLSEIDNRVGNWLLKGYIYYKLIEEIEKLVDDKEKTQNFLEIKERLGKKISEEIVDINGNLRSYSYIKYAEVLPKEILKKNIDRLLLETGGSLGVLQENGKILEVENLQLALLLYEQGYKIESDRVFDRMKFFLEKYAKSDKISTEVILLYLTNIYYRGLI